MMVTPDGQVDPTILAEAAAEAPMIVRVGLMIVVVVVIRVVIVMIVRVGLRVVSMTVRVGLMIVVVVVIRVVIVIMVRVGLRIARQISAVMVPGGTITAAMGLVMILGLITAGKVRIGRELVGETNRISPKK